MANDIDHLFMSLFATGKFFLVKYLGSFASPLLEQIVSFQLSSRWSNWLCLEAMWCLPQRENRILAPQLTLQAGHLLTATWGWNHSVVLPFALCVFAMPGELNSWVNKMVDYLRLLKTGYQISIFGNIDNYFSKSMLNFI